MTRSTLERLAYITAHRLIAMEPQDSQAIHGKQWATKGKQRSVAVDRIAAEIVEVFDGAEQAELAEMMTQPTTTTIAKRERR